MEIKPEEIPTPDQIFNAPAPSLTLTPEQQGEFIQAPPVQAPQRDVIRQPVFTMQGANIEALTEDQAKRYSDTFKTLNELGMITAAPPMEEGFVEGTLSRLGEYTPKEAVEILRGLFDPRIYDEQAKEILALKLQEYESTDNAEEKARIEAEMFEAMLPIYDDLLHRSARTLGGTGYALTVGGLTEGIKGIWRTLKRGAKLVATPFQMAAGNKQYEDFKREWFYTMEHPVSTTLDALFTRAVAKVGVRGVSNVKAGRGFFEGAPVIQEGAAAPEGAPQKPASAITPPDRVGGINDIPVRKQADIMARIDAEAKAGTLPKEFYDKAGTFDYPRYADTLAKNAIGEGISKPTADFEAAVAEKVFDVMIKEQRAALKGEVVEGGQVIKIAKKDLLKRAAIDKQIAKKNVEISKIKEAEKAKYPQGTQGTLFEEAPKLAPQAAKKISKIEKRISELNDQRNALTNKIEKTRGGGKLPAERTRSTRQAAAAVAKIVRDREAYRQTKQAPDYIKRAIAEEWDAALYNEIGREVGLQTGKVLKYGGVLPDAIRADIAQRAAQFKGQGLGNMKEAADIATGKGNEAVSAARSSATEGEAPIPEASGVEGTQIAAAAPIPSAEIIKPKGEAAPKPTAQKGTLEYDKQLEKIALEKAAKGEPLTVEELSRLADVKEVGLEYLKQFKLTDLVSYVAKNIIDKVVRVPISILDYRNIMDFLREMGLPELANIENSFWKLQSRARTDFAAKIDAIDKLFKQHKIDKAKFFDDYQSKKIDLENKVGTPKELEIGNRIKEITDTFADMFDLKEQAKYREQYLPHLVLEEIANRIKEGKQNLLTADQMKIKNAVFGEAFDPFLLEREANLRHLKDPVEALRIYTEAAFKKAFLDADRTLLNTVREVALNKAKQAGEWLEEIDNNIQAKLEERAAKVVELESETPARPKDVIESEISALDNQIKMLDDKKATDPALNQKGWNYIKDIVKEHIEEISTTQKVSDRAFLDALSSKEPFSIAYLWGVLKNPLFAKKMKIRNPELKKGYAKNENIFRFEAEVWNEAKKAWEKRTLKPSDVIGLTPISKLVGNVKMLHYSAVLGVNIQNFILQITQALTMLSLMPTHAGLIPTLKSIQAISGGLFKTLATVLDPKARAALKREGVFATLERVIGDAPESAAMKGGVWQNAWNKVLEGTLFTVKAGEFFTRVWSYEMSKNILKATGKDRVGLYEINQIAGEMSRFTQQFWSPIHTERMLKGNFAKSLYHLSSYTIKQWKLIGELMKATKDMKNPYVKKFIQITRDGGDGVQYINKLNNEGRLAVVRWALLTYASVALLKTFFDISMFNVMANKQLIPRPDKSPIFNIVFEGFGALMDADFEKFYKLMGRNIVPAGVAIKRLARAIDTGDIKWALFSKPALTGKEVNY